MSERAALLALADRVEREEPSRELAVEVAQAWGWLGRPVPDHLLTNIDAAMSLTDWCIAHLSEIGGDGLPMAVLTDGTRTVTGYCFGAPTSGPTALARALAAAALRALAEKPMTDDLVEKVALAFQEASILHKPQDSALHVLEAVKAAGYRIVPVEPTEEQARVAAALRARAGGSGG